MTARPKLSTPEKIPNPVLSRTHGEIFQRERTMTWKKGQITNPKWLQRHNGYDFVSLNDKKDLADLERFLSGADDRLHTEYYNTFTTGMDKADNPMIVLYDQAEDGDMQKRVIIVCVGQAVDPLDAVALAEKFCGVE